MRNRIQTDRVMRVYLRLNLSKQQWISEEAEPHSAEDDDDDRHTNWHNDLSLVSLVTDRRRVTTTSIHIVRWSDGHRVSTLLLTGANLRSAGTCRRRYFEVTRVIVTSTIGCGRRLLTDWLRVTIQCSFRRRTHGLDSNSHDFSQTDSRGSASADKLAPSGSCLVDTSATIRRRWELTISRPILTNS